MSEPLRYYFDEHIPHAVSEQLRARGIDVLTTVEAGHAAQQYSDAEQLATATRLERVLVSQDHHFVALAASQQPHAGIVYFPVQLSIGACVEYVELLAVTTASQEMRNQLIYGKW